MDFISNYPVTLTIEYPGKLDKLSTFFRIFYAIPILIVLSFLSGILFPSTLLMILFRQKYPKWWFEWNVAYLKFSLRVDVYLLLLRDEYPSTDEEQAVHLEMKYPDAKKELNRWMPLVKWFLAIPHYIILSVLSFVVYILVIIAWFVILFTGSYPKGLFDFVAGVLIWAVRVMAYAFMLVTDRYPPFSLEN